MPPRRLTRADHRRLQEASARFDGSVLGCYPNPQRCRHCGKRRRVYSLHVFADNSVLDCCKPCLLARFAGRMYIRNLPGSGLPAIWERDEDL